MFYLHPMDDTTGLADDGAQEMPERLEWQRIEAALDEAKSAILNVDRGERTNSTGWASDELMDAWCVLRTLREHSQTIAKAIEAAS